MAAETPEISTGMHLLSEIAGGATDDAVEQFMHAAKTGSLSAGEIREGVSLLIASGRNQDAADLMTAAASSISNADMTSMQRRNGESLTSRYESEMRFENGGEVVFDRPRWRIGGRPLGKTPRVLRISQAGIGIDGGELAPWSSIHGGSKYSTQRLWESWDHTEFMYLEERLELDAGSSKIEIDVTRHQPAYKHPDLIERLIGSAIPLESRPAVEFDARGHWLKDLAHYQLRALLLLAVALALYVLDGRTWNLTALVAFFLVMALASAAFSLFRLRRWRVEKRKLREGSSSVEE